MEVVAIKIMEVVPTAAVLAQVLAMVAPRHPAVPMGMYDQYSDAKRHLGEYHLVSSTFAKVSLCVRVPDFFNN